jgi:hypothetical protein
VEVGNIACRIGAVCRFSLSNTSCVYVFSVEYELCQNFVIGGGQLKRNLTVWSVAFLNSAFLLIVHCDYLLL